MKNETVAVHGGYETEPTTRAVAVPIYQTVAYEFESADHGAALFNLEVEGHRYSRISNPTVAVLERRIAELEGGVEALCVASGQAALNYAVLNLAEIGSNIVSVPQLYGTTHTLFAHILPSQGIAVRFAESDRPGAVEKLIDDKTRAIFCESVGNPAGNICDIEALAAVAHKHGVPLDRRQHGGDADPAAPDRLRRRHRRAFADQIHGRPRHHHGRCDCRQRPFSLGEARAPFPDVQHAGRVLSRPRLHRAFRRGRLHRALPQRLSAHHRRGAVAAVGVLAAAGDRDRGAARRAPRRECAPRRRIPAPTIRASVGSIMPASRTAPITRWRRNISAAAPVRC